VEGFIVVAVEALASETWWPREERVLIWLEAGSERTFRGLPRRRVLFPFFVMKRWLILERAPSAALVE